MATNEQKGENNRIKEKLRKSYGAIVESIDPGPGIANKPFEDGVITIRQLQDIKRPDDSKKRAEHLLYILYETQHPSAFISFRDALRLSADYNWILESLGEKPTVKTVVGAGKKISLLKVIGQGGYGVVHKAEYFGDGEFEKLNSGRIVAYKKLKIEIIQDEDIDSFKKEAELNMQFKHKNIIKCLGTIFEPGNYGIIFELAEYGELRGYLGKHNDLRIKLSMLHDVASGMEYLHGIKPNPVIHGDLKIQNVLVGIEKVAKICDFGFSHIKDYSQSRSVGEVRLGTVTHILPENWNDNMLRKTEKFDVYSFGICAWEIITLKRPFENARSNWGLIQNWVLNGQRPSLDIIPPEVPERISNLIRDCWGMVADDRPSFTDIVSHCCENEQNPNDSKYNTNYETVKLPTSGEVQGITSWNKELYVVTSQSPDIDVYDIDTLAHRRKIRVKRLVDGWDIVAHANVLYVSEWNAKLIHRIQLSGETSSDWFVNSGLLTMSINKKGNVVVSCYESDKIIEYTPTGSCVREIQVDVIDKTIAGLKHAIQLDDDRFLICHVTATHHRVCMINSNGRMIKSYGGGPGSEIGQMDLPSYLLIDHKNFVVVADKNNHRIIQLNASLEFIREFIPGSVGLNKPWRMHLKENKRRLFFGEDCEQTITAVILSSCHLVILKRDVQGITSCNDKLYVVTRRSPDIDMYDIDTLAHRRKIRVEGLADAWDIVAYANVLYVSEYQAKLIHRIQLPGGSSSHWSVDGGWLTMSINKKGNIVVSCRDFNKIIEYTPTGSCVREIQVNAIDRTIRGLRHAIQFDDDRFVICHASTSRFRVCIIDSNGGMIKRHGGRFGSGIGNMRYPCYLVVDRNGMILVVDRDNDRIIQLNASLQFIRELIPGSVGLKSPRTMHLHEDKTCLYIAESCGIYICHDI